MVPRFAIAVVVALCWAVGSVVGMTYGTLLYWPDYVHVNYGFPLTFATHTLSTIAGPVDKWQVDVTALSLDLSFWLIGMIALFGASAYFQSRVRTGVR
ncbi:MAG: hypothetical protein M1587_07800 [Thaumarchaeota archaeon]|nr:hypothetical protein [Nitrososphaerota archaeon]